MIDLFSVFGMPKLSDVIIAQLISSLTEFLVVVSTLGAAKSLNSVPSSQGCPWCKPTFPAVSLYLCQAAVAPRYKQTGGTRLEYHDGARDGSPQPFVWRMRDVWSLFDPPS
jgi:hypothetical protein